jgi:hypothetical protein
MSNKKEKPYLEFAGNVFYVDLNSILEVIKIDPPIPIENIVEEKPVIKKTKTKKPVEETKDLLTVDEFNRLLENSNQGIQIDISKWEILRLMIEALMSNHSEIDDKLGIAGLNNNSSIPFKIAFNTLLKYNILQEEE